MTKQLEDQIIAIMTTRKAPHADGWTDKNLWMAGADRGEGDCHDWFGTVNDMISRGLLERTTVETRQMKAKLRLTGAQ